MTTSDSAPPHHSEALMRWASERLSTPGLADDAEELFRRRAERQGSSAARRWYRGQVAIAVMRASVARRRASSSAGNTRARPHDGVKALGRGPNISWLDIKLGFRMLAKYPVMTLVSGFAISVTVAAALATFSVFEDFFLRPVLPLPEGDRIVSLGARRSDVPRQERRVLTEFEAWRDGLESLDAFGLWREIRGTVAAEDGVGRVGEIALMSASGFEIAAVPPLLGRPLLPADEVEGAEPVVVIGFDEWTQFFGSDPSAVGAQLRIGRDLHTVVGVMPEGFGFPVSHSLWVPLRDDPAEYQPFEGPSYHAFGRLAPGVSLREAQAEMEVLSSTRAELFPATHEWVYSKVMSYTDPHVGMSDVGEEHDYLVGAILAFVTLLVLIPFANVAILVYARTATRSGEIAIRTALGAGRRRVVKQLFTEALVLSSISGLFGVWIATYGWRRAETFLATFGASIPFWANQGRTSTAAMYVLCLVVIAAVVAGVVPGLKATGPRVEEALKRAASGNGMRLGRGWTGLIIAQVAITTAVLPTVGWVAWDAIGQGTARARFEVDDLLGAHIVASQPDPTSTNADPMGSIREVIRRVQQDPRVSGAVLSTRLPDEFFTLSLYAFSRIEIDGVDPPAGQLNHSVGSMQVEPGFFSFLDVPVIEGRSFAIADTADAERPIIVNLAFVEQQLGGQNAIGRRIREWRGPDEEPAPWREIIGVVAELAENPLRPDAQRGRVFSPLVSAGRRSIDVTIRVPSGPGAFLPELERIAARVDPALRIEQAAPLTEERNPVRAAMRHGAIAIGLVLLSVLVLCTAGVFSLTSFNVTQRRREIGIRTALGATHQRVLAYVMRRSATQLVVGAAIGSAIAFAWPPFAIDRVPVDRDPRLAVGLAVLMLTIGLVATVVPVRRGLAVQPTECLREE